MDSFSDLSGRLEAVIDLVGQVAQLAPELLPQSAQPLDDQAIAQMLLAAIQASGLTGIGEEFLPYGELENVLWAAAEPGQLTADDHVRLLKEIAENEGIDGLCGMRIAPLSNQFCELDVDLDAPEWAFESLVLVLGDVLPVHGFVSLDQEVALTPEHLALATLSGPLSFGHLSPRARNRLATRHAFYALLGVYLDFLNHEDNPGLYLFAGVHGMPVVESVRWVDGPELLTKLRRAEVLYQIAFMEGKRCAYWLMASFNALAEVRHE
jgi:hypothetical protein